MSAGRMTGLFERGAWTQDALLAAAFAGYTKREELLHEPIEPEHMRKRPCEQISGVTQHDHTIQLAYRADEPPKNAKPIGTRLGFSNYLGLLGALLGMIVLFSLLSSHFLTYDTFSTIANQIPDLVVMSIGMTFVLIIAGIDLSVGSVLALGAALTSVAALQWHWPALAAALLGMAGATLTGCVTGAVTVAWRIPSFIVSLGVLEAARGLAYQMTNSRTAYIGDAFDFLSNPIAFGISPAFLIAIVVMIVAQFVLTRTVFGRYLVGIGTNEEAVRLAGVNPRPYKIAVFAMMGLLSGPCRAVPDFAP